MPHLDTHSSHTHNTRKTLLSLEEKKTHQLGLFVYLFPGIVLVLYLVDKYIIKNLLGFLPQ
jgi:hypothetical protein